MSLRPIAQIYFTRKGFCPGRGCVPIVIDEALDAPPESFFLPGTGNA
jgi:hypothetical protein